MMAPTRSPSTAHATEPSEATTPQLALRLLDALRTVIDPELGLDVVSLGMIAGPTLTPTGVRIALLPTAPLCPYTDFLVEAIRAAVREHVPEVAEIHVEVRHDPPWSASRMSAAAKHALGWDE